ncbi:TPA: hypothetical protein ACYE41_002618 [Klebsiella pneumoniae]|uniref:hypothetical protein n=1 Tax=Klebsiella pneumoniae TaxID=573 RepID=UPI00106BBF7C|nr:hypothetical protein [Klebsiella pneumoniae]EIX9458876.1 hypothetical protein [Klebsiella pneumoniae]MDH8587922.1 hypothetical protein [Klebsiella pneumoniae]MDZ1741567.1 hypothetical protein [Klebsiella pneumoniae]VFT56535.1 Uncharacterised protein [Klebsiella pneumoniae]HBQ6812213.1 hypothetical protein [Klebsiella pneumoniae]
MVNESDKTSMLRWLQENITPTSLGHFFSDRGISPIECPICHKTEFTILSVTNKTEEKTIIQVLFSKITNSDDGLESDSSDATYQYTLTCKHCGFQHFFSVTPVQSWFRDCPIFDDEK